MTSVQMVQSDSSNGGVLDCRVGLLQCGERVAAREADDLEAEAEPGWNEEGWYWDDAAWAWKYEKPAEKTASQPAAKRRLSAWYASCPRTSSRRATATTR